MIHYAIMSIAMIATVGPASATPNGTSVPHFKIYDVYPWAGLVGDRVEIRGAGFNNLVSPQVFFGSCDLKCSRTPARILYRSDEVLEVVVPAGDAESGPVVIVENAMNGIEGDRSGFGEFGVLDVWDSPYRNWFYNPKDNYFEAPIAVSPVDFFLHEETIIRNESAYFVDQIAVDGSVVWSGTLQPNNELIGSFSPMTPGDPTIDVAVRIANATGPVGTKTYSNVVAGSVISHDYTASDALIELQNCNTGIRWSGTRAIDGVVFGIDFFTNGNTTWHHQRGSANGTYGDHSVDRIARTRTIWLNFPGDSDTAFLQEVTSQLTVTVDGYAVRMSPGECL